MNLGAEPKKVVILGVLVLVGGYFFYSNVISDSNEGPPKQPGAVAAKNQPISDALNGTVPIAPAPVPRGTAVRTTSRSTNKTSEEFHPSMKRKPEEAIDPASVDPTLRLDLLAKVQNQQVETAGRNPFQFGQPPAPQVPKAPAVDPKALLAAKNQPPKPPEPPKAPEGPPKPAPLNLPWKYYGYTSPPGSPRKRAFFLDGEEIMAANEGDVIKKKYKVVRIGVNSVVMEDVDSKSQQTLPLAEEAMG
jgi:hypothetical protein